MAFQPEDPYKSKGERWIGEFLREKSISFFYEHPVAVMDEEGKTKIWYPDFWLPQHGIVIEYCGLSGNEKYKNNIGYKIRMFSKMNIDMIEVYPRFLDKAEWKKELWKKLKEIIDKRVCELEDY